MNHSGASLATLLHLQDIQLDVQVADKKALFEKISLLFAQNYQLDAKQVQKSLMAREDLGSTGLGQGVAIPHGRIKGLQQAYAAFFRLKEPIPFDSPDGKPVNLIFVLLVPEQATQKHLELLSELAQFFCQKSFRESLQTAANPEVICGLFSE